MGFPPLRSRAGSNLFPFSLTSRETSSRFFAFNFKNVNSKELRGYFDRLRAGVSHLPAPGLPPPPPAGEQETQRTDGVTSPGSPPPFGNMLRSPN